MRGKRIVKCVKCGSAIDKIVDIGWQKNEKTGRYMCDTCSNIVGKNKNKSINYKMRANKVKNTYSENFYKTSGRIIQVLSIFIFVLSLLLLLIVPSAGVFFIVLSVALFLQGNKFINIAKDKNIDGN